MKAALHQPPLTPERDRLVDLVADFFERAYVSIRRAWPPVKSAEGANHVTDIRVIYVAIDDVSDDVVFVFACANLIGCATNASDFVRFKQQGAVVGRHAL